MIEVDLIGISKKYGDQLALDNVSVAFRRDNITAIVGRSGSGKSTLLKCINGLVLPTSGKVVVNRGPIGYVIQGSGLFPHLTVSENISITRKEDASRIPSILESVGLHTQFSGKYPFELSGGEQQRVAICRALYMNAPILLMDEPFGSLDTMTRRELHTQILNLNLTIIFVTHDVDEAIKLADDILVLERGQVQQFGSKDEILHTPANSFVRDLFS